jgi:hypothetical protein
VHLFFPINTFISFFHLFRQKKEKKKKKMNLFSILAGASFVLMCAPFLSNTFRHFCCKLIIKLRKYFIANSTHNLVGSMYIYSVISKRERFKGRVRWENDPLTFLEWKLKGYYGQLQFDWRKNTFSSYCFFEIYSISP